MADENMESGRTEEQKTKKETVKETEVENGVKVESENEDTNKEEKKQGEQEEKVRDTYIKLRKVLSTAALSVALISWYTTANGLHQYVFDNLWQAYVISAALQGALFALSIKGIEIFLSFKIRKRVLLVIAWALLLVSSSIFSYVYISRDVYPDKLLCEDAHRIMGTYCLTQNYKLDKAANELLHGSGEGVGAGIVNNMVNYAGQLAVLEDGIDLSEGDYQTKLRMISQSLDKYKNWDSEYIDTSYLIVCLDTILTGKYTEQDIEDARKEIQSLLNSVDEKINKKNEEKEGKIKERDDYQERLKGYTNTEISAYKDLVKNLKTVIGEIKTIDSAVTDLQTEKGDLDKASNILDSVENSIGATLYDRVIRLRSALNTEKIQAEDVRQIAEEIYSALLEHNIVDDRFKGYSDFMNNTIKYDAVMRAKESMEIEIEALYDLRSVYAFTYGITDSINEEYADDNTVSENVGDGNEVFDTAAWRRYWQRHFNSLKKNAKMLRTGGLDEELVEDLIAAIEEKERLYLSDLNDFERAWGLLWGKHTYKTLLRFSLCFSFGIDLFSVLMSVLLYVFKTKAKENKPHYD